MWTFTDAADASSLPFLCFPFAGGTPQYFRAWSETLGVKVIVADRSQINDPDRCLKTIAQAQLDWLLKNKFDFSSGYFTYGHSLGALNNYEFMLALKEAELPLPEVAFFSAMNPPHNVLGEYFVPRGGRSDKSLTALLKRFKGTPEQVLNDQDMLQYFLPLIKKDFSLLWGYQFLKKDSFNCPVSVFCGENDSLISNKDMEEWKSYGDQVTVEYVPGDHFFIQSAASPVFEKMREKINQSHIGLCSLALG